MPSDELDCQIKVSEPTREALKAAKTGNETYDDVIRAALRDYTPEPADPVALLKG